MNLLELSVPLHCVVCKNTVNANSAASDTFCTCRCTCCTVSAHTVHVSIYSIIYAHELTSHIHGRILNVNVLCGFESLPLQLTHKQMVCLIFPHMAVKQNGGREDFLLDLAEGGLCNHNPWGSVQGHLASPHQPHIDCKQTALSGGAFYKRIYSPFCRLFDAINGTAQFEVSPDLKSCFVFCASISC